MSPYGWLADGVLVLHAAFVVFVIGGQGLILAGWWRGWEWVRGRGFRFAHLGAIGFVVVQSWLGWACPLTVLENHLRSLAGQAGYGQSFVGHWLGRLLFYQAPGWVFALVYTVFGVLVVLSLALVPPRARRP